MVAQRECIPCKKALHGHHVLYCSRRCKNRNTNFQHQVDVTQKQCGAAGKCRLIRLVGGGCNRCGYHANLGALESHHATGTKGFQLDMRAIASRSWRAVRAEAEKCELLSSNSHAQVHRPDLAIENLRTLIGNRYRAEAALPTASSPPDQSSTCPHT